MEVFESLHLLFSDVDCCLVIIPLNSIAQLFLFCLSDYNTGVSSFPAIRTI